MSRESTFGEMTEYETDESQNWDSNKSRKAAIKFLSQGEPVVLYGPPGTGKSRMAKQLIDELRDQTNIGKVEEVQFHQKFSYEDFIQGYRPSEDGFRLKPGVFKRLCKFAKNNPEEDHVIIIDEFNRTELSTTLGEVLYLIEDRKQRSVRLGGGNGTDEKKFSIPSNLNIIGTMNTADRTTAVMDFALRRRFTFIPVWPDYEVMESWIHELDYEVEKFTISEYTTAAQVLNNRIIEHSQMNKHMQLGHTLFVPNQEKVNLDAITDRFRFTIIPQLERYVGFGREDELEQFVGVDLTQKLQKGRMATTADICNLVTNLINDNAAGTLDNNDD